MHLKIDGKKHHFSTYTIDSRRGVYLCRLGHKGELLLTRQIRHVWEQLPEKTRDAFAEFWQEDPLNNSNLIFAPAFEMWERSPDRGDPNAVARATALGRAVYFNGPVVRKLPNFLTQYLFAHELAHCDQWRDGTINGWTYREGADKSYDRDLERDADARAAAWGFPHSQALDLWFARGRWARCGGDLTGGALVGA
jgi:hypothetical protein